MNDKSILVINTPSSCKECDIRKRCDYANYIGNPTDCPLIPLPPKKNTSKLTGFGNSQIVWTDRIIYQNEGWNEFIDYILGETE